MVTILIPAYNEAKYIESTIGGIRSTGFDGRILVVDDGSKDDTAAIVRKTDAEVISSKINQGKGAAINKGLSYISSGIVVFIDGDTGQSAAEFYKLVEPVLAGEADMAIGILPSPTIIGGFGIVKKTAQYFISKSTGRMLKASLSGQRAANRDVLTAIGPMPEGFAMEVGMSIRALELGYRLKEVPVKMKHRESGRDLEGFIHRGRQLYDIVKYWAAETRNNGL